MDKWCNIQNQRFYDNLSISALQNLAEIAGLNDCIDLQLIKPYLNDCENLIDIGSGYGRVIEGLIKHKFKGHISSIERSQNLCQNLQQQFPDIHLYQQDLLQLNLPQKYDVLLWLWSGIADFMPDEQVKILNNLNQCMKPSSHLIIDCFDNHEEGIGSTEYQDNYYTLEYENEKLCGFKLSQNEMRIMCAQANLEIKKIIYYTTPTKVARTLYILQLPIAL